MMRLSLLGAAAIAVVSITVVAPAGSPAAAPAGYRSLTAPQRIVDTRDGERTVDMKFAGIGKRAGGATLAVDVAGRAGLGADPGTVVLNLTVDQPVAEGFVTVWPCDQERPTASNLNHTTNQTVAVAAVSRVAPNGTVCVFTLASTHLVIDVAGAFPPGTFDPLPAPERLADTREGEPTIDGRFSGQGLRPAGNTYRVSVAGRGTMPDAATAVALNVTATTVAEPGFLTVYPCDSGRPNASNVNYEPGSTTPNLVITRLDPAGDVCVYTLRPVDLVIDVAGSLPATVFAPLNEPRRLLDTRAGQATIDGSFRGGGLQQDGATLQLPVAGRAGVPATATAVVLNVTSTGASAPGFVTVHPQGTPLPGSSNVNVVGGRTVANLVIAGVGPSGDVCLFTRGTTHLVVDVAGWLTGPIPTDAAASCPARATPETAATYRNAYVRRPGLQRVVGVDRIAVYLCKIPFDSTAFDGSRQHTATADDFAALANTEVAPYFAEASGGRYTVEFVAEGTIQAGRTDGPDQCIDQAIDRTTAPYTNALIADSTLAGGGFASPGTIFPSDSGPDFTVFDRSVDQSRRGGWVGGAVISDRPNAGTIVHEIGHTVHWPHSYVGPVDEYDNPVDVMSSGFGTCRIGFLLYPCEPGSTLAFNRLASDWLRDGQVISHQTGTANYVLDRPGASGLQVIVAPDPAQPLGMLTIEARPAVGRDAFLDHEGVALHVIDQVNRYGGLSGLSTARINRQAIGSGGTYDHVIDVGGTVDVHGLSISVLRRVGDRYELRVAGTYSPPGASFFTEWLREFRRSCAPLGSDRAISAGCVL
jgi:hypothetical protein